MKSFDRVREGDWVRLGPRRWWGEQYKVIAGLGQALCSAMAPVARIDATRKPTRTGTAHPRSLARARSR